MPDLAEGVLRELIENENDLGQLHERINRMNDCSQIDKECRGIDRAW
jgi:hypothetical protein